MKIAITGGTGFIGNHLTRYLLQQGHEIVLISRTSRHAAQSHVQLVTWNQLATNPELLEGIGAIINLAGSSINQRWTDKNKQDILQSRLVAADRIAKLVNSLKRKPDVVVNAAGMSIYGTSLTDTFTETSPYRIDDFLSSVCIEWEKAADRIPDCRIVKLRIGLVLGSDGGAFPKMAMPYRLGIGGKVGSGKQWLSWIHIDDMVRMIDTCIQDSTIQGALNATAPAPVTNDEFGRILARVLKRPHWFPVPAFMMKLVFGELATLLLDGQRVIPQVMLDRGFSYHYPTLTDALQQLCKQKK
jgi:uncharacterized protein (TIGR01777 family)